MFLSNYFPNNGKVAKQMIDTCPGKAGIQLPLNYRSTCPGARKLNNSLRWHILYQSPAQELFFNSHHNFTPKDCFLLHFIYQSTQAFKCLIELGH